MSGFRIISWFQPNICCIHTSTRQDIDRARMSPIKCICIPCLHISCGQDFSVSSFPLLLLSFLNTHSDNSDWQTQQHSVWKAMISILQNAAQHFLYGAVGLWILFLVNEGKVQLLLLGLFRYYSNCLTCLCGDFILTVVFFTISKCIVFETFIASRTLFLGTWPLTYTSWRLNHLKSFWWGIKDKIYIHSKFKRIAESTPQQSQYKGTILFGFFSSWTVNIDSQSKSILI